MQTNADYVVIDRSKLFEYLGQFLPKGDEDCAPVAEAMVKWVRENEEMMLTIPEFQKDIYENTQKWFPNMIKDGQIDLNMVVYGIAGEAGECADWMKKFIRGDFDDATLREKLAEESVDLFHYICLLWVIFQIDAGEVYFKKSVENESRFGDKAKLNGQG